MSRRHAPLRYQPRPELLPLASAPLSVVPAGYDLDSLRLLMLTRHPNPLVRHYALYHPGLRELDLFEAVHLRHVGLGGTLTDAIEHFGIDDLVLVLGRRVGNRPGNVIGRHLRSCLPVVEERERYGVDAPPVELPTPVPPEGMPERPPRPRLPLHIPDRPLHTWGDALLEPPAGEEGELPF